MQCLARMTWSWWRNGCGCGEERRLGWIFQTPSHFCPFFLTPPPFFHSSCNSFPRYFILQIENCEWILCVERMRDHFLSFFFLFLFCFVFVFCFLNLSPFSIVLFLLFLFYCFICFCLSFYIIYLHCYKKE